MERGWNPNAETSPNCPRCGSCDTKFCYYNNYSLTQPRYFCKGCRRYWTKGGSLRNVPVGGGCRRSRRGKSIRLSLDRDPPRVFPYRNDHFTLSASKLETNNGSAGRNIDIAQVYANFLNPQPESEPRVEMTGLPLFETRDHPSLISQQLSGVSNMRMEFSSTDHHDHLPLENSLAEYPDKNDINGSDLIDHKQLQENTSQFTSDLIWNYGLPTWLGEWVPAGSDQLMDPLNHILDAPQKPEAVGIEQEAQNSDLFVGNNYGNSVYTSMSGHGTLFRPW